MSLFSILFLTSEELSNLTDRKIPKAQMRWLDRNKYPYEISAAGKPKVLRSYVLDKLQNISASIQSSEPNFDAIR